MCEIYWTLEEEEQLKVCYRRDFCCAAWCGRIARNHVALAAFAYMKIPISLLVRWHIRGVSKGEFVIVRASEGRVALVCWSVRTGRFLRGVQCCIVGGRFIEGVK